MTSFSSKLSRVRSVKLSAFSHKQRSTLSNPPSHANHHAPTEKRNPSSAQLDPSTLIRSIHGPMTTNSFRDTLRVISREAQSGEFADVFDSFFFSDKRCQNRAFFMAARLKHTLRKWIDVDHPWTMCRAHGTRTPPPSSPVSHSSPTAIFSTASDTTAIECTTPNNLPSNPHASYGLWERITHRFYTLNYILFVLPSSCPARERFLDALERQLAQIGDGQQVLRRGGMEAHFVVRYTLRQYWLQDPQGKRLGSEADIENLVERAREVFEQCLESESKLGHAERDAMYVLHGLRMGLLGTFEPHIDLEEDVELAQELRKSVEETKLLAKPVYMNPFEDDAAIVTEEDDVVSKPESTDCAFNGNNVPQTVTTAANTSTSTFL